MRVAVLGAGVGRRLGGKELPPKILLRFGGRTLLARHAEILFHCGIKRIDVVVGYRAAEVEQEIARIGAVGQIVTHFNPDYEAGAIVSFAALREVFTSGEPVVFMDGDVLYDHRMMQRLLGSPRQNPFLMDRITEEGDDPVKLCMRDGILVDFHKRPHQAHDWWGEWVGFCRFDADIAAKVVAAAGRTVEAGRRDEIYEGAIQEVVLAEPPGTFDVEDITGLPWVEIDFPEDLEKAKTEILPSLVELPAPEEPPEPLRQAGS